MNLLRDITLFCLIVMLIFYCMTLTKANQSQLEIIQLQNKAIQLNTKSIQLSNKTINKLCDNDKGLLLIDSMLADKMAQLEQHIKE